MNKKERTGRKQEILEKQKYWDRLMKYYQYVFFALFLSFSLILFFSKAYMAGIGMLLIAWYIAPMNFCRKYDQKLGIFRQILFFAGIFLFAFYFYNVIKAGL